MDWIRRTTADRPVEFLRSRRTFRGLGLPSLPGREEDQVERARLQIAAVTMPFRDPLLQEP